MPTMNNVHIHIGYEGYVSWSVENHTRENVLDHLEREAFYGVGTAMTMGDQPADFAIKFQQDQLAGKFPPAARFFFAAGMAPPGGGPDALLIQGTTAVARCERSLNRRMRPLPPSGKLPPGKSRRSSSGWTIETTPAGA